MKILQYLPVSAARSILDLERSTFKLQSLAYYRSIESRDSVADPEELSLPYDGGGTSELLNNVLVSCWSIAENQNTPRPQWDKMARDEWKVAVLSETSLVASHIRQLTKGMFSSEPRWVDDQVRYGKNADSLSDKSRHIFCKRPRFADQAEYRFAVWMSSSLENIESLVLCNTGTGELPSYIKSVFLRGGQSCKEKDDLLIGIVGTTAMQLILE